MLDLVKNAISGELKPLVDVSEDPSFDCIGPLMTIFRESVDLTTEACKEISWEKLFAGKDTLKKKYIYFWSFFLHFLFALFFTLTFVQMNEF